MSTMDWHGWQCMQMTWQCQQPAADCATLFKQHVCDLATALHCRAVFTEKKRRARWRTSVCLNLAMVFERADEVILPAVYSFVARSFSATPSDLANITLARALVQAVCSPVGGVLGMPRAN